MAGLPIKIMSDPDDGKKPEGNHYLLGSNGAFISLKNDWCDAVVPVDEVTGLQAVQPSALWKLPPIPADLFKQIVAFFHEIGRTKHTEVAVLLHYGPGVGWKVTVPQQEVSAGSVSWEWSESDKIAGTRNVGTMHSHVNMSAFHSGVDIGDEAQADGLHVTIGKVSSYPQFDMNAEIVIRGQRFVIRAEKFVTGVTALRDELQQEETENFGGYVRKKWNAWNSGASHEFIEQPDVEEFRECFPREWNDNVRERKWGAGTTRYHGGTDYGSRYDIDGYGGYGGHDYSGRGGRGRGGRRGSVPDSNSSPLFDDLKTTRGKGRNGNGGGISDGKHKGEKPWNDDETH